MVQALDIVRILALVALGLVASGCLFEGTRRAAPAAYRDVSGSLKDETWGTYTVTPAKPQAKKSVRIGTPAPFRPTASAPAANEDCGTPDQCALSLKLMIEDSERRWISQWPSSASYADGTRLFAYRALRPKLSCDEITLGLDEARAVSKFFASAVPGVTAEQVTRVQALTRQVESELRAEHAERCDPSSSPRPAS